jgi:hypothetical protein
VEYPPCSVEAIEVKQPNPNVGKTDFLSCHTDCYWQTSKPPVLSVPTPSSVAASARNALINCLSADAALAPLLSLPPQCNYSDWIKSSEPERKEKSK